MNEQLKIIISAEIDKLKSSVKAAKEELDGFKKNSKVSSEEVDANLKKMGESTKTAFSTVGTAIAAATTALVGVSAATKEYQTNQSKLNTAFQTAGASAGTAKQVYNDLYRVLGEDDTAVEAAGHLAQLTTNQKDLQQWTTICQGVYATFGDSLPIEGLTEAANETAKTGTVTGSLADALNWAGISEDAFNEKLAACATEQEREKLIRETLNGVYKEAAANYEKTAADVLAQNEAQAKLQAALSGVGAAMTPVLTAFTSFAADALAVVLPYVQQLAQTLLPALQTILAGVTTALQSAFTWASQHKTLLAAIAIVIGTVTAAILAYNVVQAVKAAMAAAEVTSVAALTAAYIAQGAAMLVAIAPYVLVVAGISAIIAAIVLCVKHWDDIKAKVSEVWNGIKTATQNAVEAVKTKFENMKTALTTKVESIKTSIVEKFKLSGIGNAIGEAISKAKEKFESMKTAVKNKVDSIKTSVLNVLKFIGIGGSIDSAKSTISSKFDSIKTTVKNKIDAAKDSVKNAIDKIKGFFNFSWSLPKLKLPSIGITGKFSLNPPSTPKFSINWNALGGVFDKPTLFGYGGSLQGLGEDGAEAVVPLEKNTQWLDRIADRLAAKQNGIPIILQVDGKTFAQVSIDSINALTKQRGSLGLNLV